MFLYSVVARGMQARPVIDDLLPVRQSVHYRACRSDRMTGLKGCTGGPVQFVEASFLRELQEQTSFVVLTVTYDAVAAALRLGPQGCT